MIKFVTTQGINYHLEELLKDAQKEIIIVTPYVKINFRLREILQQKKKSGVNIIIVCRKKDLNESIDDISSLVVDRPNLHAKCYVNENIAIVGSLNMYEFSQVNNDEMGFCISNEQDSVHLYEEVKEEAKRLCGIGEKQCDNFVCKRGLIAGKKYSDNELEDDFCFEYKKRARIKISESGDIALFIHTSQKMYEDKYVGSNVHFQGQNTGKGCQELKYANKSLYDCFNNYKNGIYLFKDYVFSGRVIIGREPYSEDGKWYFPLESTGDDKSSAQMKRPPVQNESIKSKIFGIFRGKN
ncbi:MAG: hypothetical protein BA863_13080 [Desulfovibrio sp. S3730MH75]|nr:MAG: hypothetical protein BA863_13080 [Desulfovibrio sp. S3730MH75]